MAGARKINNERFFRFASESDLLAYPAILKQNQEAYILNTTFVKFGDGVRTLAQLPYMNAGGATLVANITNTASPTTPSAIQLPTGPSAGSSGRPSVPVTSLLRINTTNSPPALEYYNGTNWMTVTAAISAV